MRVVYSKINLANCFCPYDKILCNSKFMNSAAWFLNLMTAEICVVAHIDQITIRYRNFHLIYKRCMGSS